MRSFPKILKRLDVGLIQLFFYIGSLFYVFLQNRSWWSLFFVHLFFVLIYGIVYLREEFLLFFFAPLRAIIFPFQNYYIRKYLKQFNQNTHNEVVIVLGRYDWFKLWAWIKPNFFKDEITALVKLLKAKKQTFSFYPEASFKDVESIMADNNIKEVYFFGHGDSHTFQLNTDEILYYCDFNDAKYTKEYVHQVHCGTEYGKSLVDYVVPKENQTGCFFFRKTIMADDIKNEFNKRAKDVTPA